MPPKDELYIARTDDPSAAGVREDAASYTDCASLKTGGFERSLPELLAELSQRRVNPRECAVHLRTSARSMAAGTTMLSVSPA